MDKPKLSSNLLDLDVESESRKIENWVTDVVSKWLKKRGVVIGLSGGIDSSVCAAICVRALGKERVFGLFTPERECKDDTTNLAHMMAEYLEVELITEDISSILDGFGCYRRRDEAMRMTIPEMDDNWKSKVVLPDIIHTDALNVSNLVAESPDGKRIKRRMKSRSYLQVVAASNFKQRTRKILEYYHAERKNYAVVGTPNRLEYDLGFFVRYGDGAADLKPIAHLYKSQVYDLGKFYGIPDEIIRRVPTTDTYSLPQNQEEFYFTLPYPEMDMSLYAYYHGYEPSQLCAYLGVEKMVAERIFSDIERKKEVSKRLRLPPYTLERTIDE